MNTQELINKLKAYPFAVGSFILAIVCGLVVYFRSDELPKLEDQLSKLDKEYNVIKFNELNAANIENDLEIATKLDEEIRSRLMDKDQKTQNVSYFYNLEEATGVVMNDPVQVGGERVIASAPRRGKRGGKDKKDDGALKLFSEIEFRVEIEGSFTQVMTFLYELRTGKYFSRIKTFNIMLADSLKEGRLKANFSVMMLGKGEAEKKDA